MPTNKAKPERYQIAELLSISPSQEDDFKSALPQPFTVEQMATTISAVYGVPLELLVDLGDFIVHNLANDLKNPLNPLIDDEDGD